MQYLALSILIAFLIALACGPFIIPELKRLKFGQNIREDGPQSHLSKAGTPTMGGVIMLVSILITLVVLWPKDTYTLLIAVVATLGFGAIGFADDYIKVVKKRNLGLRAKQKLLGQVIVSIVVAIMVMQGNLKTNVYIPFVNVYWDMGLLFVPFIVFFMIALTNSVNLTDGLDGLASGVMFIITATFGIIYYFAYNETNSETFRTMIIFCGAITGACLGFLRFNAHPAKVFMGDTGSLALGGALSVIAIMIGMEFFIPIMGFMFMASTISDIIQVTHYKRTKRRVFKMAPLHHHFELSGMKETNIVLMYMATTLILCVVTILIL